MGCMLPAGNTFLHTQYSMSAMSKELGWVMARWVTESESNAVICNVMPRSSLHLSAMALMFETPVPNWRRVTFLMFCAQMVGKPVMAPDPIAAPAAIAALPFRKSRREGPALETVLVLLDILPSSGAAQWGRLFGVENVGFAVSPTGDHAIADGDGVGEIACFVHGHDKLVGIRRFHAEPDPGALVFDRSA